MREYKVYGNGHKIGTVRASSVHIEYGGVLAFYTAEGLVYAFAAGRWDELEIVS